MRFCVAYYTSFGAAGEVTGSCHLLEIGKTNILIDCGMFQGEDEHLNFEKFGFNPDNIHYLILTHAHLDHIGRVPLLIKKGFNGTIIATKATYDIARLMLKNSASILECEEEPLYTVDDAYNAFEFFNETLEYDESMQLDGNIKVMFKNAGHILGATSVKIEFIEDELPKSVIFSGDIGQRARVITSSIDYWDSANYVFLEATYGATIHENLNISINEFKDRILQKVKSGGTVVIPSFALERTQEILYILRKLSLDGQLKGIKVFLDAPLAINVTKTFLQYPYLFSDEVKNIFLKGENPFAFKELINCATKDESIGINSETGPKIIIAGSGMCEGGRVKYHLQRYLEDESALILFVGYQVRGTLGRKIRDEISPVHIKGKDLNINAEIFQIDGFSAHADQKELLDWIVDIKDIYCVYLIHGDLNKLEIMKDKVRNVLHDKVHIVKMKERIYL